MKTIYIDPVDFKCHTVQNADGTLLPHETEFFDGKCDEYILGHRVVPFGYEWTRSDGVVFAGEMNSAWKDYDELDSAQRKYERQLIAEYESSSILTADLQKAYEEGVASA